MALLRFIRDKGYKRLGVVKTELGFLNHVVAGIEKNLRPDESLEMVDNFQTDETDFKTSITKLKNRNYDAVGVFLGENQVASFYQQAVAQEFKKPTFGSHSFASKSSVTEAKGAMTGAVYPAIEVSDDFKKRYVNKHGNDLQISFAGNAYDFAMLTASLFSKNADRPSSDEIIQAFNDVKDFEGVSGPFSFIESANGSGFEFEINVRRIEKDNSTTILY